jgi:2-oxoisovalerate dehydrogenase E1 component beta subunit
MTEITYLQAIQTTILEEMTQHPQIILIGQDIGIYEGAFKVTSNFIKKFGTNRIIDSPISETGMIGVAAGASAAGLRPIIEIQFIDFISCSFNQISNLIAKFYYRTSKSLPIVIRSPAGGGLGLGPFHSQNPESYYLHTPGIKIVCPSTVKDAGFLMKAALHDDNPVIFIEYKKLYRHLRESVFFWGENEASESDYIGKACVRRYGSDVTVVTFGPLCLISIEVAKQLYCDEYISVEVIDLRSLNPLDIDTIVTSVKKTGKIIILHESTQIGGIAGEICAKINEAVFEFLDGPLLRVAARNCPIPYNQRLEKLVLPSFQEIYKAVKWLANY